MKSRKLITVLGSVVVATLLGGCSATVYSSTSSAATDDLYVTHNRKAIAAEKQQRLIRQQEAQRAAEEAERARREEVARAVRRYHAPLVGLSALMTTTLKSMADTIALLHLEGLPCKIMVGGAVLTPEYASQIQADFYARDAKESVDIAKRVIG